MNMIWKIKYFRLSVQYTADQIYTYMGRSLRVKTKNHTHSKKERAFENLKQVFQFVSNREPILYL